MRRATPPIAPARHRSRAVASIVAAVVACTAVAVIRVSRRHAVVRLGYELVEARDAHRAALEANRRLALERAMLRHPDRIARIAASLGLRPPEPHQIRVVRSRETVARRSGRR